MKKIAMIGAGAMASAILTGLKNSGLDLSHVWVSNRSEEKLETLKVNLGIHPASTSEAVKDAGIVILAVKPQTMPEILPEIRTFLGKNALVVSIAAGLPIEYFRQSLRYDKVVRAMPNTPLQVGLGMTGICTDDSVTEEELQEVRAIFDASGKTLIVKEAQIDALSGISGCGPAFMYLIADALAEAGVFAGLSKSEALLLVAQTMKGSGEMLLTTGLDPSDLKAQVTSPGGTTIAGVRALEKAAVRSAMMDAVVATIKRSKELSDG